MQKRQPLSFASAVILAFVTPLVAATQNAQQNADDAERLIRALEIRAGHVVGEVGAGDGALTLAVAEAVGAGGRVYSNETNEKRLAQIRDAAGTSSHRNIVAVQAGETATNFPDGCCDAIFMRDVYHHFTEPAAMNASLLRSLKPGGRLAILDFGPPPGAERTLPADRAKDGHHGVTSATLQLELRAAGFEIVASSDYGFRNFIVVARRPGGVPETIGAD